jgi:hypothetical protein
VATKGVPPRTGDAASASRSSVARGRRLPRWVFPTLAATLVWVLGAVGYIAILNRADRHATDCFQNTFVAPPLASGATVMDLGVISDRLELKFGQNRGPRRDEVQVKAENAPAGSLEIGSTALRGGMGTIEAEAVHVTARVLRNLVLVDACLDLRGRSVPPGRYEGTAIITDPRVSALTIPMTAVVQARYLWFLSPLVLLFPLLGLLLIWSAASDSNRPKLGLGALKTIVLAIGATAVAFGGQGVSNESWGGVLAAGALIATMYTAAVGVTATLGGNAVQDQARASGSLGQPNGAASKPANSPLPPQGGSGQGESGERTPPTVRGS